MVKATEASERWPIGAVTMDLSSGEQAHYFNDQSRHARLGEFAHCQVSGSASPSINRRSLVKALHAAP
jgi:hypothetical protein